LQKDEKRRVRVTVEPPWRVIPIWLVQSHLARTKAIWAGKTYLARTNPSGLYKSCLAREKAIWDVKKLFGM
jgi:hypothetical protein